MQVCLRGRGNRLQDLLLEDEPTGNLDKENSRKMREILKDLNQEKMTIVMGRMIRNYLNTQQE